jgi:hypothetical protein
MELVRRSGPGGQHRNKVSTAVVLVHRPTGMKTEANERRSQSENRTVAIFRLRLDLALKIRSPSQANSSPSQLWQSRLSGGRIEVSPTHDDFPALLAEVLDVFAACEFDPKSAAAALKCSVSQLVKFLKKEPRSLMLVNHERAQRGLHGLQ